MDVGVFLGQLELNILDSESLLITLINPAENTQHVIIVSTTKNYWDNVVMSIPWISKLKIIKIKKYPSD